MTREEFQSLECKRQGIRLKGAAQGPLRLLEVSRCTKQTLLGGGGGPFIALRGEQRGPRPRRLPRSRFFRAPESLEVPKKEA